MKRRIGTGERGAALVETAIVLPVILVIIMGVVDIGRVLSTSAKLQEAAQEGALYASYAPSSYADTRDRVLDSLGDFTLDTTNISILCLPGDVIEVRASHDIELLTPWISDMIGPIITLDGEAVGQNFTSDTCDPTP